MAYKLIRGRFRLFYQSSRRVGSRPDGDSVWFQPDDPALLGEIEPGRSADMNGGGMAQLRFEGVDALELHYNGLNHQLVGPTVAARDALLGWLGFDHIEYAPNDDIASYIRSCTPESLPGHILSRKVDPFGRPVAFVFNGDPAEADGADVFLTPARMRRSLNARLMDAGHVYPGYYDTLPWDLRDALSEMAVHAWNQDSGVWPLDRSNAGFVARDADALTDLAIWPKLYRRLAKYFADGNSGLAGFEDWLRAVSSRDDDLWIIPEGRPGNLHDIFRVSGRGRMMMLYWPEELIITPG